MRISSLIISTFIGLALIGMVGCGSPHEKAQKKMINLQSEYADILGGIKSNTDLVDAKPKLERLGAKMKDLNNEVKALPTPTADEMKKLDQNYEADQRKVGARIMTEMQRLTALGISPAEIMDAMKIDPTEFGR